MSASFLQVARGRSRRRGCAGGKDGAAGLRSGHGPVSSVAVRAEPGWALGMAVPRASPSLDQCGAGLLRARVCARVCACECVCAWACEPGGVWPCPVFRPHTCLVFYSDQTLQVWKWRRTCWGPGSCALGGRRAAKVRPPQPALWPHSVPSVVHVQVCPSPRPSSRQRPIRVYVRVALAHRLGARHQLPVSSLAGLW